MKVLLLIAALHLLSNMHLRAQRVLTTQADSPNVLLMRSASKWEHKNDLVDTAEIFSESVKKLDSLVGPDPSAGKSEKKTLPFRQTGKPYKPYKEHFSFGLALGYWQQAESSRTEFDTATFVDIAKCHFIFGILAEYNFTEKLSVFTDANFVIISKNQSINSVTIGSGGIQATGSGHGGIVIPFGAGVRYAFLHGNFRPFIMPALGFTHIHVEGGTGSGGPFSGVTQNITKKAENVLTYRLGAGFDYRLSGSVSLRLSTTYFMSEKIDPPAGSIENFQGLSATTGLTFILGK